MARPPVDPRVRFDRHVSPTPTATGCRLWVGALFHDGYGVFHLKVDGRAAPAVRAHRYIYEQEVGPIPPGWVIGHKCNVRACVNSEHLIAQPQRENILYSYQTTDRKRRSGRKEKRWSRPPPREVPSLLPGDLARFWAAVSPPAPMGCRLWLRFVADDGYGRFWLWGKKEQAHRVAARIYFGRSPLPHEVVMHLCGVRHCVAEAHLKIGTQRENIADAIKIGAHNSVRQMGAKLDEVKAEQIRQRLAAGETQSHLAREFGVSQTLVWNISKGRSWQRKLAPPEAVSEDDGRTLVTAEPSGG